MQIAIAITLAYQPRFGLDFSDRAFTQEDPMVSVVIPCFNCAATLEGAVRSVLRERFDDVEIILVDDGSYDDSVALFENLTSGANARVIRNVKNKGLAYTRAAGVSAARGCYVQFVDADDELENDILERAVRAIAKSQADMVMFNEEKRYRNRQNRVETGDFAWANFNSSARLIEGAENVEITLLRELFLRNISAATMHNKLVKRAAWLEVLREIGKDWLSQTELTFNEDVMFTSILFQKIKSAYVMEPGSTPGYVYDCQYTSQRVQSQFTFENMQRRQRDTIASIKMLIRKLPEIYMVNGGSRVALSNFRYHVLLAGSFLGENDTLTLCLNYLESGLLTKPDKKSLERNLCEPLSRGLSLNKVGDAEYQVAVMGNETV